MTQEQKIFVEKIGSYAATDMQKSGVLASLTIAQAILESGWGKSGLTVHGNALFGIKATASWKGKVYNGLTQECFDGVRMTAVSACFRAYDSWADSIADHSALLTGAARYKAVIGERDYKKACAAIKAAGYATDPAYTQKLIVLIEQNDLARFDTTQTAAGSETEQQLREKVVAIANSFYGAKESNGRHRAIIDTYNAAPPLARGYKMNYTDAWCACFVSVVAIKAGLLSIMPKEVSCEKMIALYKALGRWEENDAFTPQAGDVIFYDWQDSGAGDNTGASDHVGLVVSVANGMIRVIEGNMSNAVGYRNIAVNGKTIRGFGLPDYASMAGSVSAAKPTTPQKPDTATPGFNVGDMVQFTGGNVYASATTAKAAATRGTSICRVTHISRGAHPLHLISTDGKGVYGWVDAVNVQHREGLR